MGRSFGAQMKQANRLGARLAAILGEDELAAGVVTLRDMSEGNEAKIPRERIEDEIAARLARPAGARSTT